MRTFKLRSRTRQGSKAALQDMALEFEDGRAFIIWDSVPVGAFELKARIEIDLERLEPSHTTSCDFLYRGEVLLPCPQNN